MANVWMGGETVESYSKYDALVVKKYNCLQQSLSQTNLTLCFEPMAMLPAFSRSETNRKLNSAITCMMLQRSSARGVIPMGMID